MVADCAWAVGLYGGANRGPIGGQLAGQMGPFLSYANTWPLEPGGSPRFWHRKCPLPPGPEMCPTNRHKWHSQQEK